MSERLEQQASGSPELAAAPALPRDSSPTWELEMLISGAVLFSLFQLPPILSRLFSRWEPHMTYEAGLAMLMAYAYLKGALYTLIVAFVVHFAARAYWVGLIGLDSVFANGIRWERTKLGPLSQEIYRERMTSLPQLIARFDNFASVIFSFAFLVVLIILMSFPLVGAFALMVYGISHLLFGGARFLSIFLAIAAVLVILPMSVTLIDQKYGARLDPSSTATRWLRRLTRIFYRTQLVGVLGPILFTISTNSRRKATYALFYLVLIGSLYAVLGEWMLSKGVVSATGADFFSTRSDANTVNYDFYESQWTDDVINSAAPSIQSDVVRDPYVRLFIPYQPSRHNPTVALRCPGTRPLQGRGLHFGRGTPTSAADDSASTRVLRCLVTMHDVKLNGAPISGVRFRFATHPRTGVDGFVAYIRTDGLPRGENLITVLPPPRRPTSTNKRPLEPYVIPFWL